MKIHHIGYAVSDIETAISKFEYLNYSMISDKIDNARNVRIVFMRNYNYLVELVSPINRNSPVNNILLKMGPTPYHICYKTTDIDKTIADMVIQGWLLVKKKERAIAIENRYVAFLYNKVIGLIELVETEEDDYNE